MTITFPLETSSTTTQVEDEAIVGGHANQFAHNQFRHTNALRDIGLDVDIDLSSIAVVGSQSSGKSSLIYSTTGIPLPKAPGEACTKCPMECRLTRREAPWSCAIFLRRRQRSRSGGQNSFGLPKEPFGEVITDSGLLTDRILRAQLAILNPRTPAHTFLDVNADLNAPTEVSFTSDIVCLEITGPEYSDISFIDLPGLIRNVGTTGNRENIQLIEELATEYISKPNCIILMTITCETDFANQGAYDLVRTHDPSGKRTVGVLTKPDRIPDAAHEKWVQYIGGEIEPLRHGWFCVKQHDSQSPGPPPNLAQVREYEEQYFNKTSAWRSLPRQGRDRLGTRNLVRHLEEILSQLIQSTLPDVKLKIRELQDKATHELEQLGKPPSDDSVGEINTLVDQLVHDIEGGIEQRSLEGDLLRRIENEAVVFISDLRATCPEFRAWNRNTEEPPSVTPLPELLLENGGPSVNQGNREVIYLEDVLNKKTRSSARGLPDGEKNEVAEEFLRSFTANWDKPTDHFVKRAHILLRKFIHKKIDTRCGNFSLGGLPTHLREAIEVHLIECREQTQKAATLLLKVERSGHTRNEDYFRQCKDKFLNHLTMQRELAGKNPILRYLNHMVSQEKPQPHASFISSINTAVAALRKAGVPLADELQLAKLLPSHPTDAALEDMAKASAGFEVALRRFVDYVPLVVDTELVRGVCQDLSVTLRRSFRFSEPGAAERCKEFLRESSERQAARQELRQKLYRLAQADEVLRDFDFWGPGP